MKSLRPGEEAVYGDVTIKAVEAYNVKRFRSPGVPFHPKGLGVGYLISSGGKTIYHVGDSDYIPEMNALSGIDVLLIPSGGTYTMDNDDAAEAAVAIGPSVTALDAVHYRCVPSVAIPMHMWDTDSGEFQRKVESSSDVKVSVLSPGDTYEV